MCVWLDGLKDVFKMLTADRLHLRPLLLLVVPVLCVDGMATLITEHLFTELLPPDVLLPSMHGC